MNDACCDDGSGIGRACDGLRANECLKADRLSGGTGEATASECLPEATRPLPSSAFDSVLDAPNPTACNFKTVRLLHPQEAS